MASPRLLVFFLYNATTGAPQTGQLGSLSFTTYKKDDGTSISAPSITEIGGGAYAFNPFPIADISHGIVYVINCGSGVTTQYVAGYLRPEDYIQEGKWSIITSGIDANKLIIYQPDGVTPLMKFDLYDSTGVPTTVNPYSRLPE